MKQRDLIKLLKQNGWWEIRHTGNHIVFTNGTDIEPVPKHKELNEMLAKSIIKRRGLK